MRVLVDANVIVDEALAGTYVPLLVPELTGELRRKIRQKPYLSDRITPDEVAELVESLRLFAEELPLLDKAPAERGRDRKDDYLFAHAIAARADFIASGDKDVTAVGQIDGVRILSTAEFASMLRAMRAARQQSDPKREAEESSDLPSDPD